MIFIGTPDLFVRISNKNFQRLTGRKGFYFDNNGRFETDNEILCKILKQHFEVEEEVSENKEIQAEVKETFKCKKCDFETDNKGLLMAHYKEKHPKEGK